MLFGSVLKKKARNCENFFDNEEIYPYRIEGLGKKSNLSATDFDIIDKVKVTDEKVPHFREITKKKEGLFVGYFRGVGCCAKLNMQKRWENLTKIM
jgi:cystathionine beta-synthase